MEQIASKVDSGKFRQIQANQVGLKEEMEEMKGKARQAHL